MRAVILAAGVGERLGSAHRLPKCLLEFAGRTLLQRHLEILDHYGIHDIVIGVGYRAECIEAAIAPLRGRLNINTVYNPDYTRGSIVTLWTLRDALGAGGDTLLMDADVLHDHRLLRHLLKTAQRNCFLLDRNLEPGEEPVKLCIRRERLVEFRKQVQGTFDDCGESVGFFRLAGDTVRDLLWVTRGYIAAEHTAEPHEEALRDLLLARPERFGYEDVTGLPWIEIDFPEDVVRAETDILPRLRELPGRIVQHCTETAS